MADEVYTIPEVCQILKCSRNVVTGLIKTGQLKAIKPTAWIYRIPKKYLELYIDTAVNQ